MIIDWKGKNMEMFWMYQIFILPKSLAPDKPLPHSGSDFFAYVLKQSKAGARCFIFAYFFIFFQISMKT